MNTVLIYPPPWKINPDGRLPEHPEDGPPPGLNHARCLQGDILNIPSGLLSLAAQARRAGHTAAVLNLFSFAWNDIEKIIRHLHADLYGLSCFTSNRRGTLMLAGLIRRIHPGAHIAVGGPHATALPREIIEHCAAVDTAVIGEGEETFAELCRRIARGKGSTGLAGAAWREGTRIKTGPARPRIENLDALASPFDYYNEYILTTSRGCPWDCSFCASSVVWGREHRCHSPAAVLAMLEQIVNRNGQKAVAIKDETFTLDRERVLSICNGILERNLNFLWSCDTRADALDEELLSIMRRAGCQRISLGVESAVPDILKAMQKKIAPETVCAASVMAKRVGMQVRFYLIVGARGETPATLRETIEFVKRAGPSQAIYNPFTLLPGTREFALAEQAGRVARDTFFTGNFFELNPLLMETESEDARALISWTIQNSGLQYIHTQNSAGAEAVVKRFPELHAAHLDLAGALYRRADLDGAREHLQRALELAYPLPGLCYNYLACIATRRGDLEGALAYLIKAKEHGFHQVVEENVAAAQSWITAGGPGQGIPLELRADHSFEVTRPKMQPMTPGPITIDGHEFNPVAFS
ncbi:cobalamin-dependent protein [Thermodesulfobacteriota bacterium]